MSHSRWSFTNPFPRNGCVPCALAHLAGKGAVWAAALAATAATTDAGHGFLIRKHGGAYMVRPGEEKLYDWLSGRGWIAQPDRARREWCRLAGLRGTEVVQYPRRSWDGVGAPTVTQFAKTHRRGRWLVLTYNHAIALIEGRYYGDWAARSRVYCAVQVEPLAPAA